MLTKIILTHEDIEYLHTKAKEYLDKFNMVAAPEEKAYFYRTFVTYLKLWEANVLNEATKRRQEKMLKAVKDKLQFFTDMRIVYSRYKDSALLELSKQSERNYMSIYRDMLVIFGRVK